MDVLDAVLRGEVNLRRYGGLKMLHINKTNVFVDGKVSYSQYESFIKFAYASLIIALWIE